MRHERNLSRCCKLLLMKKRVSYAKISLRWFMEGQDCRCSRAQFLVDGRKNVVITKSYSAWAWAEHLPKDMLCGESQHRCTRFPSVNRFCLMSLVSLWHLLFRHLLASHQLVQLMHLGVIQLSEAQLTYISVRCDNNSPKISTKISTKTTKRTATKISRRTRQRPREDLDEQGEEKPD